MDDAPKDVLSTAEARDQFADIVDRAADAKERIVLTRDGRPVAAVVPVEDLELLEEIEDERDSALLREARAEWERTGRPTIPLEEVARKYGVDLSEDEA